MSYISQQLRAKVAADAGHRCGYCQASQKYVFAILEIEHIIPTAHGGSDAEDNLWLACSLCNGYKREQVEAADPETGERVRLFNPRTDVWQDHFEWSDDGAYVIGLTMRGRATVVALQLNNRTAVNVRRAWISVGWHPPK